MHRIVGVRACIVSNQYPGRLPEFLGTDENRMMGRPGDRFDIMAQQSGSPVRMLPKFAHDDEVGGISPCEDFPADDAFDQVGFVLDLCGFAPVTADFEGKLRLLLEHLPDLGLISIKWPQPDADAKVMEKRPGKHLDI